MSAITTHDQPEVKRVAPIVTGRKDYLSVLLRLIGMDLYKVSRRWLSRVLLLVGLLVSVGIFLVIGIAAWHYSVEPVTDFVPAQCSVFPHNVGCIRHPATLTDMQHEKQHVMDGSKQFLDMPGIWNLEERFLISVLVVLGILLAGGLVGGEYSLGTVRLMFSRGPTRLQFLLAKMVVLAIFALVGLTLMMLAATLVGYGMAQVAGVGTSLDFFTAGYVGHLAFYLLLGVFFWFAYMLMALCFGTVGRSTVAGIVAPLIWLATEQVLNTIVNELTGNASGGLADFVKAVPDYFLGNNLTSLLHSQGSVLSFTGPAQYTTGHSLLVVGVYLVVFVGVASFLTVRRDVTH